MTGRLVLLVALVALAAPTLFWAGGPRITLPTWLSPARPTATRARAPAAATALPTLAAAPTAVPTAAPTAIPTPEGPNFIVLRASELAPDAHLNVVGQGFIPSEDLASAIENTAGQIEGWSDKLVADPSGRLNDASVTLPPNLGPGEHRLRVEGLKSGRIARATFRLTRMPARVELLEYSIKSDNDITVSGVGFAPNEQVEVRLGGLGGAPLARLQAGPSGEIVQQAAHVPLVQPGDYALYLVGLTSQAPASVTLNVRGFTPWVVLDNYSPPPYYSMGFKGEDFAPGEEVAVYLGDRKGDPVAHVYADETGRFDAKGVVPLPELHGETPIIFIGSITRKEMTATFNALGFQPGLELTEYAGRAGMKVGFIGVNWAREDSLHAYIGDASGKLKVKEVSAFRADASGAFKDAGTFRIPPTTKAGGLPLTIVGDVSQAEVTIWFELMTLKPSAELTSYKGPSGTSVSFSANGFAGGEAVTVHLRTRDGQVVASATADDNGSFEETGAFTVEGEPNTDAIPFVFVGEESKGEAMTHFKVLAE